MNKKVYEAIMSGQSDNNIKYTDFQNIIVDLGFDFERQRGSHTTYRHKIYFVKMNIQPRVNKAKDYQVKQLRNIIKKYRL
jgi:predicted RNA binding protein YcfA (HicA-like mRNA interferase family)